MAIGLDAPCFIGGWRVFSSRSPLHIVKYLLTVAWGNVVEDGSAGQFLIILKTKHFKVGRIGQNMDSPDCDTYGISGTLEYRAHIGFTLAQRFLRLLAGGDVANRGYMSLAPLEVKIAASDLSRKNGAVLLAVPAQANERLLLGYGLAGFLRLGGYRARRSP